MLYGLLLSVTVFSAYNCIFDSASACPDKDKNSSFRSFSSFSFGLGSEMSK